MVRLSGGVSAGPVVSGPGVQLIVNGMAYSGWERVEVTRSLEALAGAFELEVFNRWGDGDALNDIRAGDPCELQLDGETVITGVVDEVDADIGEVAEESVTARGLTLRGRDRSGQLVDCSAMGPPNQWKGNSALAIIRALCAALGVSVTGQDGGTLPTFAIEPGESVHDALVRICRARALLLVADRRGNLAVMDTSRTLAPVALTEGANLLRATARWSHREQFSEITVRGQSSTAGATTKQRSGASATARDPNQTRYRPLLVMAKEQATAADCQRQANWEMANRNGKALTVTATVYGWRQAPGRPLWDINQLVQVSCPSLGVDEALVINDLTYRYGLDGTTATLTLVRPGALLPEPPDLEPVKRGKRGRKGRKGRKGAGKKYSEAERRRMVPWEYE